MNNQVEIWPIGKKHRGKRLAKIPIHYLRWALCECTQLVGRLRKAVRKELVRRGDRYVEAWVVLGDLEETLTARLATDDGLDHEVCGKVTDHLLLATEAVCERHGISDGAQLLVPRRVVVESGPSNN